MVTGSNPATVRASTQSPTYLPNRSVLGGGHAPAQDSTAPRPLRIDTVCGRAGGVLVSGVAKSHKNYKLCRQHVFNACLLARLVNTRLVHLCGGNPPPSGGMGGFRGQETVCVPIMAPVVGSFHKFHLFLRNSCVMWVSGWVGWACQDPKCPPTRGAPLAMAAPAPAPPPLPCPIPTIWGPGGCETRSPRSGQAPPNAPRTVLRLEEQADSDQQQQPARK